MPLQGGSMARRLSTSLSLGCHSYPLAVNPSHQPLQCFSSQTKMRVLCLDRCLICCCPALQGVLDSENLSRFMPTLLLLLTALIYVPLTLYDNFIHVSELEVTNSSNTHARTVPERGTTPDLLPLPARQQGTARTRLFVLNEMHCYPILPESMVCHHGRAPCSCTWRTSGAASRRSWASRPQQPR